MFNQLAHLPQTPVSITTIARASNKSKTERQRLKTTRKSSIFITSSSAHETGSDWLRATKNRGSMGGRGGEVEARRDRGGGMAVGVAWYPSLSALEFSNMSWRRGVTILRVCWVDHTLVMVLFRVWDVTAQKRDHHPSCRRRSLLSPSTISLPHSKHKQPGEKWARRQKNTSSKWATMAWKFQLKGLAKRKSVDLNKDKSGRMASWRTGKEEISASFVHRWLDGDGRYLSPWWADESVPSNWQTGLASFYARRFELIPSLLSFRCCFTRGLAPACDTEAERE